MTLSTCPIIQCAWGQTRNMTLVYAAALVTPQLLDFIRVGFHATANARLFESS